MNVVTKTEKIEDGKQQSLVNALEALRLDVASLKGSIKSGNDCQNNAREAGNDARRRPKQPACVSCQEQGKNDCYHCYICGSNEHYARGCKKRSSGNEGQEVVHDTTKESHLCASCGKNNVL